MKPTKRRANNTDLGSSFITYDKNRAEWRCKLGDSIGIRVTTITLTKNNEERLNYAVQLKMGNKVISTEGHFDTPHQAFQAAYEYCQNLFDEYQQALIQVILKMKESPGVPVKTKAYRARANQGLVIVEEYFNNEDQGCVVFNSLLSEWNCRLGDHIQIRVITHGQDPEGPEVLNYDFELKVGDSLIKPQGNYPTHHEAFQSAFECVQVMLEKSQQDLIKSMLNLKDENKSKGNSWVNRITFLNNLKAKNQANKPKKTKKAAATLGKPPKESLDK